VIGYRHVDPRYPFLWDSDAQPAGRWHAEGEGPANYFADTPDGAWAEFLRHEEITDPVDLPGVRRAIWMVDLGAVERTDQEAEPGRLPVALLTGGLDTYPRCQDEARRLRASGVTALRARSAALLPGEAAGFHTNRGLRRAARRDGQVIVLYGPRPALDGWQVCAEGRPNQRLLGAVRHL